MKDTRRMIIFVGSHPDDIEVSCGGTVMHFLRKGYIVICVFLSRGERGGGTAKQRERESIAACTQLGVERSNIVFGDFKDTTIPESVETIQFLEHYFDGDVCAVFVPGFDDTHQDHRATSLCSISAFRHSPCILLYESPSKISSFTPTVYVDITDYIEQKSKALECHESQRKQHKMALEYNDMAGLAKFRGEQVNVRFAEAFQPIRLLLDAVDTNLMLRT